MNSMLPKFLQIATNLDFIYGKEISRNSNFFNSNKRVLNELRNIPCKHSSWRHLEVVSHFRLQKTSSRRLQEIFKMSWRRLAKTFTRHLQDIFKTFWIRLQLQDVFSVFARVIKDSQVLVFHFNNCFSGCIHRRI